MVFSVFRHDVLDSDQGKMNKTLGQYVRERRAALGLTQEQVAERMGGSVRQAEISRLERDHVTLPRRHRLELLAEALETTIAELLAKSGWVTKGQDLPPDLLAALDEVPIRDADRVALDSLAALVISVEELREIVRLVDQKLGEVDATIASAVDTITKDQAGRGEVESGAGIIKSRETCNDFRI